MKKLIIIILILLPSFAFAGMQDAHKAVIARMNVASGCTTPSFADSLNEGFIGTGTESAQGTYSTANDRSAIDYDYDISGYTTSKPDSAHYSPCNEGMRVDITDSGDGLAEAWLAWDYGSTMTDFTLYFTVYFGSQGVGDVIYILASGATSTPNSVGTLIINTWNNSGTLYIAIGGSTGSNTGNMAITFDEWHTIKIVHDGDGGVDAGSVYIDQEVTPDGTYDTLDRDTRYFMWGAPVGIAASDDMDFSIGDIHIENND